jgi:hypothetical protein
MEASKSAAAAAAALAKVKTTAAAAAAAAAAAESLATCKTDLEIANNEVNNCKKDKDFADKYRSLLGGIAAIATEDVTQARAALLGIVLQYGTDDPEQNKQLAIALKYILGEKAAPVVVSENPPAIKLEKADRKAVKALVGTYEYKNKFWISETGAPLNGDLLDLFEQYTYALKFSQEGSKI